MFFMVEYDDENKDEEEDKRKIEGNVQLFVKVVEHFRANSNVTIISYLVTLYALTNPKTIEICQ